ncbi:MAG TPA: phage portal protein [Candidatus Kapabacteria bacterium]
MKLPSIFKRKETAHTSKLEVVSGSPSLPYLINPWDAPRMNLTFIRETVSAAMHARSEAIGKATLLAYDNRRSDTMNEKLVLSYSHPLQKLLREPNPLFDLPDMLELVSQWLDATGNALLLKVRNLRGEPSELWLLPALSFTIEKGSDELPSEYIFQPQGVRISARDIVHIKRSDIRTAPFYGHALLSDIIDTARTDTALRMYQQRFFENDAVPRAVLRFPPGTSLTPNQIEEIRRAWDEKYKGITNSSKLAILPDGGEVHSLSANVREIDFTKSRETMKQAIREAFRVPKIVLGDTDDVNLSNAETSYGVFMRDVVDYSLRKLSRALTRQLATEFSPSYVIEHENVIPESEERQLKRLELLKDALTIDEQRKLLGFG